jgi:hypothetical protein
LEPLPQADAGARGLCREVLLAQQLDWPSSQALDQAINFTLELSFGHPKLTEEIAAYIAPLWPPQDSRTFARQVCLTVVKPFIDRFVFDKVEPPWDDLMWWTSVLHWFDITVLREYLQRVSPQFVKGQPDYFFIQGITKLRIQNAVVWQEGQAHRLYGVIANIVRRCLQLTDPYRFAHANLAAAETMEALAALFPAEDPEGDRYREEAEFYRRSADNMTIPVRGDQNSL